LDGKNSVYNAEGELILQKSEKLLGSYPKVPLGVRKAWRIWMVDSAFVREAGNVTCYITDRRIVCVRRPDVHKAGAYLMTPVGAAEGIADMSKARMILKAGGFEYCEFLSDDVRFYKTYRTGVSLLIIDKGKKYGAHLWTKVVSPSFHETVMSWLESKGIPPK